MQVVITNIQKQHILPINDSIIKLEIAKKTTFIIEAKPLIHIHSKSAFIYEATSTMLHQHEQ